METEEVAASLAPASPGAPQQGGARKRARSVSPEPGKLEPGVEGEQGEWREGSSEESEGEESLPPGDRVAYIHVGEVSQQLHNLYTFCAHCNSLHIFCFLYSQLTPHLLDCCRAGRQIWRLS